MLDIDGGGSTPFVMKGKKQGKKSCISTNSRTPVTIISHDELQKSLRYDVLFLRPLLEDMKRICLAFKKRPMKLLGYCLLRIGAEKQVQSQRKNTYWYRELRGSDVLKS